MHNGSFFITDFNRRHSNRYNIVHFKNDVSLFFFFWVSIDRKILINCIMFVQVSISLSTYKFIVQIVFGELDRYLFFRSVNGLTTLAKLVNSAIL